MVVIRKLTGYERDREVANLGTLDDLHDAAIVHRHVDVKGLQEKQNTS